MTSKHGLICLLMVVAATACSNKQEAKIPTSTYSRWVGDIAFDAAKDEPDFKLCNGEDSVKQYFWGSGLSYVGEKKAILRAFSENYAPVKTTDTGLIRVRFLVNCRGETDRFRWIGMDQSYNPMDFDERIVDQLMAITKRLDGWGSFERQGIPQDYYQYLIFKIEAGHLVEVMP